MPDDLVSELIETAVAAVVGHADELTRLDSAIGDGDHGANMRRGFEAIGAQREMLAGMARGEALRAAGTTLVKTVGGASGPLFGTLFMTTGKALDAGEAPATALAQGVEAVKARGRSDAGAKTLLDVLVPVVATLRASATQPLAEQLRALRQTADDALEATRAMQASRGRASFLGERSRGHLDPGASSARLLVHALCDVLER